MDTKGPEKKKEWSINTPMTKGLLISNIFVGKVILVLLPITKYLLNNFFTKSDYNV